MVVRRLNERLILIVDIIYNFIYKYMNPRCLFTFQPDRWRRKGSRYLLSKDVPPACFCLYWHLVLRAEGVWHPSLSLRLTEYSCKRGGHEL